MHQDRLDVAHPKRSHELPCLLRCRHAPCHEPHAPCVQPNRHQPSLDRSSPNLCELRCECMLADSVQLDEPHLPSRLRLLPLLRKVAKRCNRNRHQHTHPNARTKPSDCRPHLEHHLRCRTHSSHMHDLQEHQVTTQDDSCQATPAHHQVPYLQQSTQPPSDQSHPASSYDNQ